MINEEQEVLDRNVINEFHKEIIVLPEFSHIKANIPHNIYRIIEETSSNETWKIIRKIVTLILSVEHESSVHLLAEFLPSIIWSHVRSLMEKKAQIRARAEKTLTEIYNHVSFVTEYSRK